MNGLVKFLIVVNNISICLTVSTTYIGQDCGEMLRVFPEIIRSGKSR